jgi:hypothetical protein
MHDYRAGYLNGLEMAKTILDDWTFNKKIIIEYLEG